MEVSVDTSAFINFTSRDKPLIHDLKNKLNETNSFIVVTFVQFDEKYTHESDSLPKATKFLDACQKKGFRCKKVSCSGYLKYLRPGESEAIPMIKKDFTDQLQIGIELCERNKKHSKKSINILRDVAIGISSLKSEAFITKDRCQSETMNNLLTSTTFKNKFTLKKATYCDEKTNVLSLIILELSKLQENRV